jgi:opacity protein-like surface antigen
LKPYVGGGLNIAHASASALGTTASDTKAGLNLLGGTTFKVKGQVVPFVEARGIIGGGKQVMFAGGVRF